MQKMLSAGFRHLYRFSLLALIGIVASSGCAAAAACNTSDEDNPDKYTQGTVEGGIFMSSPYDGPFLSFPGGKQYDLVHKLGCLPRSIEIWVSFDQGGTAGNNRMAPSAGNMSEVLEVTTDHIRIKNSTCSDLFVLVSATCGTQGTSDAGSD